MASRPTPILVMTSDPRGLSGELSIEALARGALDLVPKPTRLEAPASERKALVDKIKFLASVSVVRHIRGHRHRWHRGATLARRGRDIDTRFVALAASTGGPNALAQILGAIPFDFSAAVLVVQHMSPEFAEAFCTWLDHSSALEVRLAQHGEMPEPGLALVAPPQQHMQVTAEGRIRLVKDPSPSHLPSANELFHSLTVHAKRTTAVVLTGMGQDGAEGLSALRRAGALTLVQDPATSVVDGMPAAARRLGAAQQVLALPDIAPALLRAHPRREGT
jgi:two-component system chemotaxis response regulator CheB